MKYTTYEWDLEKWDEHGDIQDHHHEDTLSKFGQLTEDRHLVLVRDWDGDGRLDRSWAYVSCNSLPIYFEDAAGDPTNHKVPQRFHKELARHLKKWPANINKQAKIKNL